MTRADVRYYGASRFDDYPVVGVAYSDNPDRARSYAFGGSRSTGRRFSLMGDVWITALTISTRNGRYSQRFKGCKSD